MKASSNPKFAKNLSLVKFGISTALTIATYIGLTHYKQEQTKKSAEKEILKEIQNQPASNKTSNPVFMGRISDFMFNPVKNLMILDGAITAERLKDSRNKQEFTGYIIKEGSFWTFMYFAGGLIQKFLEKRVEKKHNISIDLDSRVIESAELETAFKNGELEKSVNKVLSLNDNEKLLDFMHNNPEDFTVKMAKKSDVLPVLKNASQADNIDYRRFIDFENFKGTAEKLKKLFNQYSVQSENLTEFLNSVKKLKRHAVLKNMGACIGFLGVIAPAVMVIIRKLDKNDQGFQVKEDLKRELMASAAK